jgi:chromate reductase
VNSEPSGSWAGGASVLVVSGTNRTGSLTRRVSGYVSDIYRHLDAQVKILDLVDLPAEAFAPAALAKTPPSFEPFVRAVRDAGGIHVVLPEYRSGFPAALKQLVDLTPYAVIERKPVCLTGVAAGMFGGVQAVQAFQTIMLNVGAFVFPTRAYIPRVNEVVGDDGQIMDAKLAERLARQAETFLEFARSISALQTNPIPQ